MYDRRVIGLSSNLVMDFKPPKNSDKYQWTQHAIFKLQQYGLSAQRITRVIRAPKRIEKGIAKNTIAVMQPSSTHKKNGKETWSQEIWVMYQTRRAGNPKFEIRNSKQIPNSKFQILNSKNPHPTLSQIGRGGIGRIHPVKSSLNEVSAFGGQFNRVKIISAWRYPGISPKNNPIPEEILDEINNME
jgi:hypothetical protein